MASPSVTYSFSNSTTADATQVNQNFTDLINGASDGTKDYSISALTCAGNATFNGNTAIGNASSDTLTVTASLASSIPIGTNASYDIGSATKGLAGVYIGGTSTFTTRIIGAATASYSITLPVDVPAVAGTVLQSTTGGVLSFSPKTTLQTVAKTTTYTATLGDDIIRCDTSSAWTLTLPAAASSTGKCYFIVKTTSDVNALTIDGNASETINGATTVKLNSQNESIRIACDGSNWQIVSLYIPSIWADVSSSITYANAGTVVTYKSWGRREGDSLHVRGDFIFAAVPASTLSIELPAHWLIDSAKAGGTTANKYPVGVHSRLQNGVETRREHLFYDGSDTNSIYFSRSSSGTTPVKLSSSTEAAISDGMQYDFIVPIAGWLG